MAKLGNLGNISFCSNFALDLICMNQSLSSNHTKNTAASVKNTYMLFAGREVRIGKNCARGLEYGPRPQADQGRTQDRGHSFSQYGPT